MFEFYYDPLPNLDRYLERIGYTGSREPDLTNLHQLVFCHQHTVPFENLDPHDYKKPISINTAHLYEKVVEHRRGGYCFELNGAFVTLLQAFGYDAYSCMCRVSARKDYLSPVSHRACIVRLDGKQYYCDVGLGGPMAPFAIELSTCRQTLFGETYWIEPTQEGWMMVKRLQPVRAEDGTVSTEEQTPIIFGLQPFLHGDFEILSYHCSARPDSRFVTNRTVYMRTEDGYLHLTDNELLRVKNGIKTTEIIPEADIPRFLKDTFGLEPCEYRV